MSKSYSRETYKLDCDKVIWIALYLYGFKYLLFRATIPARNQILVSISRSSFAFLTKGTPRREKKRTGGR